MSLMARVRVASRQLALSSFVLLGFGVGLAVYTFAYARGFSYLTDDPQACGNCHVMQEQLKGWERSSHRAVAVCNDCHTPAGFAAKYWVKARNGWNHSVAFTRGTFVEPIQITPWNRGVTEQACRNCHGATVQMIDVHPRSGAELACTSCHSGVGHLD